MPQPSTFLPATKRRGSMDEVSDEDRQKGRLHQNQPYDESLDVPDAESQYTPSPRARIHNNQPYDESLDVADTEEATKVYHNQPYDESLEVPDSEDVASLSASSPVPASVVAARPADHAHKTAPERRLSRGDTPPESRMSNQSDDEFETGDGGGAGVGGGPGGLGGPGGIGGPRVLGGPIGLDGGQIPPGKKHPNQTKMMMNDDEDEDASDSSDEDDEDDDDDDDNGPTVEGAYDPAEYEHLSASTEIKELFQYITRYTPQTIELETKLKPFIPDFIPAVGDIDAFLKVSRPDSKPEMLGLNLLDEPCAKQSDPTVLDLQLRALSKQTNLKQVSVRSISGAESNPKAIENWIESISELHRTKPPPNVHYTKNMPDVDSLMEEWPPEFEELLKEVSLPAADLDCSLSDYVDIICALLDIPIYKNKVQSLHLLFTVYSEFKNSQHFRSLAEGHKLDNALKGDHLGNDADQLIIE